MEQDVMHPTLHNLPLLEPEFVPFEAWIRAYLSGAHQPFAVALERPNGSVSVYRTHIYATKERYADDLRYVERLVKFLYWSRGAQRILLYGSDLLADAVRRTYAADGPRSFDSDFLCAVYGQPLEILSYPYEACPAEQESTASVGRHLNGCRIGFDAGGSDRKVAAVIDGQEVFSEEVVWLPKVNADPRYHYDGIVSAFRAAAAHLPRVDAIGVSTAGIVVDNQLRTSSLFARVPKEQRLETWDIYQRAAAEIGNVPLVVSNDGDVSALAGAMSLETGCVLGIAMGTSEAGGYIDARGNITGWLNELAFAPVDLNPSAVHDPWSGDVGVGCSYFSQDAVIRLAPRADIPLDASLTPAEKLKSVQLLMESMDPRAALVFDSIGCYLGHTIPLYCRFYALSHVLLLGRVMSGRGGDRILAEARRVLREEYPEVAVTLLLPDEKMRRLGQSVAAASLPEIPDK